ncbi:TIGR02444 family protein [Permianibacter sp. IMCC34836]|uniref:TIGR02444 family protein n=1 Tax=Permianibacter fluminis TaxID=2738515 RepID=UPI001551D847|nr:TIGR02444 family protein [Permianibacter fluminis]NQD35633.1 TIGR02444 family protein [Permianibacter fluminis]
MKPNEPTASEAFWQFSLSFYCLNGVEQALLMLQDTYGLDINCLLYAYWHGSSGRGAIGKLEWQALQASIGGLGDHVGELRALRKEAKLLAIPAYYQALKDAELAGEKAIQQRLAQQARQINKQSDRLAAIQKSLTAYLEMAHRVMPPATTQLLEALAQQAVQMDGAG